MRIFIPGFRVTHFYGVFLFFQGKQWADRVITCMVDNMHGYYHAETVDCQLMKKLADEARHICLNNEGFCEVAWRNKIALIKSFGFK